MVQIVSPQPKSERSFKIVNLLLSLICLGGVAAAFIFVFQLQGEIQGSKQVQDTLPKLSEEVAALQDQLEDLQKTETARFNDQLKQVRDLRAKVEKEIAKLKKENEVMLLNNRDFIKMFEQIQADLDTLKKSRSEISQEETV